MLERVLEPEIMDDPDESQAYDDMDHEAVNLCFVRDFLHVGPCGQQVVDLGTGTARIPIALCESVRDCRVLASDAAVSMLEIARINVAAAGFEDRIQLHCGDTKQSDIEEQSADSVISNSLIHHVPEPLTVVHTIRRLVRPGGRIFVRDLMRPTSSAEVEQLVETYAGTESEECQQLFRQSLIAALTVDEMRDTISQAGFAAEDVRPTSDRHWTWASTVPQ